MFITGYGLKHTDYSIMELTKGEEAFFKRMTAGKAVLKEIVNHNIYK